MALASSILAAAAATSALAVTMAAWAAFSEDSGRLHLVLLLVHQSFVDRFQVEEILDALVLHFAKDALGGGPSQFGLRLRDGRDGGLPFRLRGHDAGLHLLHFRFGLRQRRRPPAWTSASNSGASISARTSSLFHGIADVDSLGLQVARHLGIQGRPLEGVDGTGLSDGLFQTAPSRLDHLDPNAALRRLRGRNAALRRLRGRVVGFVFTGGRYRLVRRSRSAPADEGDAGQKHRARLRPNCRLERTAIDKSFRKFIFLSLRKYRKEYASTIQPPIAHDSLPRKRRHTNISAVASLTPRAWGGVKSAIEPIAIARC